MKHDGPPWRDGPCANQDQSDGERSYTKFAAGRTTLLSTSPTAGRDWLAANDPECRESSLRLQRFEQRRRERHKAKRQARHQARHQPQLLRGVP